MVVAHFLFRDFDHIQKVEISGHAESGPKGKDLVCAAISSQVALLELGALFYEQDAQMKKSLGFFSLSTPQTTEVQGILRALHLSFLALQKEFAEYIEVKEIFELEESWQQKKVAGRVKMDAIVNPNA